jgi:hypothetical protein
MIETPHSDCKVCSWWEARIAEHRKRALAHVPGAFNKEQFARKQLVAHLERVEARATDSQGAA